MTTDSLKDALYRDYAPAWQPQPNEVLVGTVVDITVRRGGEWGDYPIITVADDNGEARALHCFHTVLRDELGRERPQHGERIGVRYLGVQTAQSGASYHGYRVRVDRPASAFDWGPAPLVDDVPASDVPDREDVPF